MNNAVAVENLSKQYQIGQLHSRMLRETLSGLFSGKLFAQEKETFWALRDVSFDVAEGEVLGIVGRNGAGKSTLLKILARITYPTKGSVKVNGRIASLLEVGTGFHEELTGRENIYLNGSILGMKRKEIHRKLDAIIDFANVERFIDTPIKRYSSGMRLRLGFAVAAHLDPDILLVDEVLAVGDAAFQRKCLNTMDNLHSSGRTVLFISHNMEAVEHLCPRTIWIDQGKLYCDGETGSVIRDYLSTFASAQKSGLDLRDFESRSGNGDVQITGVDFLTPERNRREIFRSGDQLVIRLHYEAFKEVRDPHFGVRISTEMGTMITDISTWSTGYEISSLSTGKGSIDFEIDFLNLMPSRYYLTLWIQGVGSIHFDMLENCMEFNVEKSNYFGSGRGIDKKFGLLFFPCRWKLVNDPPEQR